MGEVPHKRRRGRFLLVVGAVIKTVGLSLVFLWGKIKNDVALALRHGKLFLGTTLLFLGMLSFQSGKYCDGNTSNYYTCTRPATYYYYPLWAVALSTLGSFLILLWFLRRNKT